MVKLTLYITVIITTCLSVNKVCSVSLDIDIQKFLQSLQQQLRLEQQKSRLKEQQYNSVEEDDDRDRSHYGSLQKQDIARIISYLTNNNNDKYNKNIYRPKKNLDSVQNDDDNYKILKPAKRVPLKINNLLGMGDQRPHDHNHGEDTSSSSVEGDNPEYSRVYVLLDSEAVKNSRSKDKLNALLSSLMSGQPGKPYHPNRDDRNQNPSYKGFVWNKGNFRRRDDSDEGYSKGGIESIIKEKEYLRPLRQREHSGGRHGRGGGGGGGGMRTAIPYIGQRGDVYERDN